MKGFIVGFLAASILVGGGWYLAGRLHNSTTVAKTSVKYHCPMHPIYIYDKPGNCPICGMKLVPLPPDFVPGQGPAQTQHQAEHPMNSQSMPAGYSPVRISPDKIQLLGVATTEAKEMDLDQSIRTTGRVVPDETRLHHIHTKFEGYIEEIYVDYTGEFVKQGQALFSIYSPELFATQREYLLALKAKESVPAGSEIGGIDLLESARQRLSLWDIDARQIAQLESTREPIKALTVRSPFSGYVTNRLAAHGMRVTPSDSLYDIVDLSRVWVLADIYEVNASIVKIGMPVTVELPYEGNRKFEGKVAYIDPVLDPVSRTLKARIEIPNPGMNLKPDMFTNVVFGGFSSKGLVVPETAVISTGERAIVYVDQGNGLFEPREVTLGAALRGFYQIRSGLMAGERVVTSGNFLLDSESRMRASVSGAQHEH